MDPPRRPLYLLYEGVLEFWGDGSTPSSSTPAAGQRGPLVETESFWLNREIRQKTVHEALCSSSDTIGAIMPLVLALNPRSFN